MPVPEAVQKRHKAAAQATKMPPPEARCSATAAKRKRVVGTAEWVQEIREETQSAMDKLDYTQTTISQEAKVSPGVLSQFLRKTYKGNYENIAHKLDTWLEPERPGMRLRQEAPAAKHYNPSEADDWRRDKHGGEIIPEFLDPEGFREVSRRKGKMTANNPICKQMIYNLFLWFASGIVTFVREPVKGVRYALTATSVALGVSVSTVKNARTEGMDIEQGHMQDFISPDATRGKKPKTDEEKVAEIDPSVVGHVREIVSQANDNIEPVGVRLIRAELHKRIQIDKPRPMGALAGFRGGAAPLGDQEDKKRGKSV